MTICLAIFEKIERTRYKNHKELSIDTYNSFIDNNFEWACDSCLRDKQAILAVPSLQNYSWNPNLAYHDADLVCRTCGIEFKFTKEEKRLWYEKLKFWIDSEPVNCLNCRRKLKLLKIENNTLSNILKKDDNEITLDELKTVADIYRKWDKLNKAKFYEALIRKKTLAT